MRKLGASKLAFLQLRVCWDDPQSSLAHSSFVMLPFNTVFPLIPSGCLSLIEAIFSPLLMATPLLCCLTPLTSSSLLLLPLSTDLPMALLRVTLGSITDGSELDGGLDAAFTLESFFGSFLWAPGFSAPATLPPEGVRLVRHSLMKEFRWPSGGWTLEPFSIARLFSDVTWLVLCCCCSSFWCWEEGAATCSCCCCCCCC